MNIRKCASVMIGIALLSSCSPKVVTDIAKTYPATNAEDVVVYEVYDSVNVKAEELGTIQVKDRGFTTDCGLDRMLGIAKSKTAEAGGNILKLTEHRYPDMRSTCHRLWGTILKTDDTTAAAGHVAETKARVDEYNRQALQSRTNIDMSGNVLMVNFGPSWITSNLYAPNRTYKGKSGIEGMVNYEHFWKKGMGFGIDFAYYQTSFDDMGDSYSGDYEITLTYVGPSFVFMQKPSDKWRFEYSLGLGYARYSENGDYIHNGFGVMGRMGVDYCISKHFGIGLNVNAVTSRFSRPDEADYYMDKNEAYGIQRISVMAGLKYYF